MKGFSLNPFRPVWYHEDDFGQVEVRPLACWNDCVAQLSEIEAFAERHRDPDGHGYSDIYRMLSGPERLSDYGLKLRDVQNLVPLVMKPGRGVTSGTISGKAERLENCSAYKSGAATVVLSWTAERKVTWIGLFGGGLSPTAIGPMAAFLHRLGRMAPLLLVDWRGDLVNLGNNADVVRYLKRL